MEATNSLTSATVQLRMVGSVPADPDPELFLWLLEAADEGEEDVEALRWASLIFFGVGGRRPPERSNGVVPFSCGLFWLLAVSEFVGVKAEAVAGEDLAAARLLSNACVECKSIMEGNPGGRPGGRPAGKPEAAAAARPAWRPAAGGRWPLKEAEAASARELSPKENGLNPSNGFAEAAAAAAAEATEVADVTVGEVVLKGWNGDSRLLVVGGVAVGLGRPFLVEV